MEPIVYLKTTQEAIKPERDKSQLGPKRKQDTNERPQTREDRVLACWGEQQCEGFQACDTTCPAENNR